MPRDCGRPLARTATEAPVWPVGRPTTRARARCRPAASLVVGPTASSTRTGEACDRLGLPVAARTMRLRARRWIGRVAGTHAHGRAGLSRPRMVAGPRPMADGRRRAVRPVCRLCAAVAGRRGGGAAERGGSEKGEEKREKGLAGRLVGRAVTFLTAPGRAVILLVCRSFLGNGKGVHAYVPAVHWLARATVACD